MVRTPQSPSEILSPLFVHVSCDCFFHKSVTTYGTTFPVNNVLLHYLVEMLWIGTEFIKQAIFYTLPKEIEYLQQNKIHNVKERD